MLKFNLKVCLTSITTLFKFMKTTQITKEVGTSRRVSYVFDAKDQILGRLSVVIADCLRGKNKPDFTPNHDCGDFAVVINSRHVKLSGNKAKKEIWYRHSGYPGGIKSRTGVEMIEKKSQELIINSVKGMLPKNKTLSKKLLHKLKVYEDSNHKHQNLIKYELK